MSVISTLLVSTLLTLRALDSYMNATITSIIFTVDKTASDYVSTIFTESVIIGWFVISNNTSLSKSAIILSLS